VGHVLKRKPGAIVCTVYSSAAEVRGGGQLSTPMVLPSSQSWPG
jgi:hypothetical protein